GPSVQLEANAAPSDNVEELFMRKLLEGGECIQTDVILSEEGGRFYQEENRNVIIHVDRSELMQLPRDYVWSDYGTLNMLTQINNCLNIQLRNLISLLEI
ncbi:MAG: NDP-hexose 2,3-dehydratase family protein, partial [Lachnospiraceae bacterium]|nr:NDP-hexose 2,3-dehydratase family protein [Lachnospiraceae bacterium]